MFIVSVAKLFYGINKSVKGETPGERLIGVIADIIVFIITHALLFWGGWYDSLFS